MGDRRICRFEGRFESAADFGDDVEVGFVSVIPSGDWLAIGGKG